MTEPYFELVFRGKLLKDFERAQVARSVMQLFKLDESRALSMLDQSKLVLKRGLGREAAQKYQDVLRQIGMMVTMVPMELSTVLPVAPSADSNAIGPTPNRVAERVAASVSQAERTDGTAGSRPVVVASEPTLAPVGTVLLPAATAVVAKNYDLSRFQLAQVGVQLVEAKPVPRPEFDLSALSLAPISDVENIVDPGSSALARALSE